MPRDFIKLDGDGHVFVSMMIPNATLLLKITPLQEMIDDSFISSWLFGDKLLAGSPRDCLYQVVTTGSDKGYGLVNLHV